MRRVMVMRVVMMGVLAALLSLGCATAQSGRPFDTAAASRIEVGKTTEAEVLSWLGQPLARKTKADGTKAYAYKYSEGRASAFGGGGHGNQLIVRFDKNGVVSELTQAGVPVSIGLGSGDKQ